MPHKDFPRITLPPDWDEQKDCEYFEDRWRPNPSYTTALWGWFLFHYEGFLHTLEAAIAYFRRHDASLVFVPSICLSVSEKLAFLRALAESHPLAAHFRERLVEAIDACEAMESERARVLKEYQTAGDDGWLYPVVALADYVGGAHSLLDEAMACENDDYRELNEPAPGDEQML